MSFVAWKKEREASLLRGKNDDPSLKNQPVADRVSQIGSVRSSLSISAADRKLEALQIEIARLDALTQTQAAQIQSLEGIIRNLQRVKGPGRGTR
jgi:hypothetical protein